MTNREFIDKCIEQTLETLQRNAVAEGCLKVMSLEMLTTALGDTIMANSQILPSAKYYVLSLIEDEIKIRRWNYSNLSILSSEEAAQ